MKKSALIAGAMALSFGILQSTSAVMAHGHGGGGHHGGGHHHHDDDGDFWAGAAVGGVIGYGIANQDRNQCDDADYRRAYPGICNN